MTKAALFTQGDITKAIKGVKAAGAIPQRVEIDRCGKIVVLLGGPSDDAPDEISELDRIISAQKQQVADQRDGVQRPSRKLAHKI